MNKFEEIGKVPLLPSDVVDFSDGWIISPASVDINSQEISINVPYGYGQRKIYGFLQPVLSVANAAYWLSGRADFYTGGRKVGSIIMSAGDLNGVNGAGYFLRI